MPSSLPHDPSNQFDIEFSVPCVHRLRFTTDCFGSDWPVVQSLFESLDGPARIQVWLDEGLEEWDQSLPERIRQCLEWEPTERTLVSPIHLISGGEAIKNDPATVDRVLTEIDRDNLDRRSYLLVIGGGAVLDAVGFAAAIAHRGIRLIRIPTTTLAQADSGVGVKNAVNAFGKRTGKGALPFHGQSSTTNDYSMDYRIAIFDAVFQKPSKSRCSKALPLFNSWQNMPLRSPIEK